MQAAANTILRWRFQAAEHHRNVSVRSRQPSVAVQPKLEGKRLFGFGLGFTGRYVSDRLKKEGWEVAGTCRGASKKIELEAMDLNAFTFDIHNSKLENIPLKNTTHLLISIPPMLDIGDPLLYLQEDLRNSLSSGNLEWLCYLSTTSVYGDCGGAIVTEEYPANPYTESGKTRLEAEKGWLSFGHELGISTYVFRLGGIYGPGRSALDTIINQKSLSEKQMMRRSKLYTARIHVADIYQAIKASFNIPSSGEVYNIVDDDPAPRAEVFAFAQSLIKNEWPDAVDKFQFGDQKVDDSVEIVRGEKRVCNAKMKEKLGIELLYPTHKSGLRSILQYHLNCLGK